MKYCLSFEKTGDVIPFDPVNQDLLDFYIDQLDGQNCNKFYPRNFQFSNQVLWHVQKLKDTIGSINSILVDLFDCCLDLHEDRMAYLDQRVLNKVHADWVSFQSLNYDIQAKRKQFDFSGIPERLHDMHPDSIQHPGLMSILTKLELMQVYLTINTQVHMIESLFESITFTAASSSVTICDNPYPKTYITNNQAHLRIPFGHLGRTLSQKWTYFDHNLEFDDENSYDQLLGWVTLDLVPHQTVPFSPEYIKWCESHNRTPIGDNLNLGIIPDLTSNLSKYRGVILQNLLQNNKFTITRL